MKDELKRIKCGLDGKHIIDDGSLPPRDKREYFHLVSIDYSLSMQTYYSFYYTAVGGCQGTGLPNEHINVKFDYMEFLAGEHHTCDDKSQIVDFDDVFSKIDSVSKIYVMRSYILVERKISHDIYTYDFYRITYDEGDGFRQFVEVTEFAYEVEQGSELWDAL